MCEISPVRSELTYLRRPLRRPASERRVPTPSALYPFSENKAHIREVTGRCAFGGCVNGVVIHLATSHMSFGGVGERGIGAYHGRADFNAFSHTKRIADKKTRLDLPMRYRPYGR